MVQFAAVMIQIRALAAAGGPADETRRRRLALRATKWIADPDVADLMREELFIALSANWFFATMNRGVARPIVTEDVEMWLTRIEAASTLR